jgi:hypothetical protein
METSCHGILGVVDLSTKGTSYWETVELVLADGYFDYTLEYVLVLTIGKVFDTRIGIVLSWEYLLIMTFCRVICKTMLMRVPAPKAYIKATNESHSIINNDHFLINGDTRFNYR